MSEMGPGTGQGYPEIPEFARPTIDRLEKMTGEKVDAVTAQRVIDFTNPEYRTNLSSEQLLATLVDMGEATPEEVGMTHEEVAAHVASISDPNSPNYDPDLSN